MVGGTELERKFKVPILESNRDDLPPIDQLNFEIQSGLINAKTMEMVMVDAGTVSDSILFDSDGKLHCSAKGNIQQYGPTDIPVDIKGTGHSKYPLDYLSKLFKRSKLVFEMCRLNFGTNYPCKFDFFNGYNTTFEFILAPRVVEDEEC
jgi:hypothetical protein